MANHLIVPVFDAGSTSADSVLSRNLIKELVSNIWLSCQCEDNMQVLNESIAWSASWTYRFGNRWLAQDSGQVICIGHVGCLNNLDRLCSWYGDKGRDLSRVLLVFDVLSSDLLGDDFGELGRYFLGELDHGWKWLQMEGESRDIMEEWLIVIGWIIQSRHLVALDIQPNGLPKQAEGMDAECRAMLWCTMLPVAFSVFWIRMAGILLNNSYLSHLGGSSRVGAKAVNPAESYHK